MQEDQVPTSTTFSTSKPTAGNRTIPPRDVTDLSSVDEGGSEFGEIGTADAESVVRRTGSDVSATKRARSDPIASPAKKRAIVFPDCLKPSDLAHPATPCNVGATPSS
ncbi:protein MICRORCHIDIA 4-like isoform X1 [Capsella rubella]|uniref:protein MICRORCHIDIA 4-like isoform X1 n=1 Tax=Capsella rubella TaxID=81985 RepID=UPI000CD4F744|nr:protein MICRORCHIDIA 4-like isoform X1 [Capsella rubella]